MNRWVASAYLLLAVSSFAATTSLNTNWNTAPAWKMAGGKPVRVDDAGWQKVRCEILQVYGTNAALAQRWTMKAESVGGSGLNARVNYVRSPGERLFVVNLPKQPTVDAEMDVRAFKIGTTNTTAGTFELWDCGAAYRYAVVTTNIVYSAEEIAAQNSSTLSRVIASQMKNASNGFEYAQFELGIRYLRGDGVETNRALAMHWLKSACTNGSSRATNALAKLTD